MLLKKCQHYLSGPSAGWMTIELAIREPAHAPKNREIRRYNLPNFSVVLVNQN